MALVVFNQMGESVAARIAELDSGCRVVELPTEPPIPDVRAHVVAARHDANEGVLEALRQGSGDWVHIAATGVDAYPREVFAERVVTCARGTSAGPIAEFVVASILGFEKAFPDVWVHEPAAPFAHPVRELAGTTVAFLGLGAVARAAAERLQPFGVTLRALRRRSDAPAPPGIELVRSLPELVRDAEHVVVACALTERTRGSVGRQAFDAMRDGTHLVNVARGAILVDDDLRAALDGGRIARASLDVTDPEPLPAGHWMYRHARVHLSPHVSWGSDGLMRRVEDSFMENLRRYLAGAPLVGTVDGREGY